MAGGKRRPHRTPTRTPNRVRHASSATNPAGASRKWNATGYSYAGGEAEAGADPGRPIHLASSSAVAFIDPNPSLDSALVPSYNYDPAIVGGLGLGFHVEEEEEEVEVDEEMVEVEEEEEEEVERGGFISIGGVRVYAEDTSSPEEDDVSGSESSESEGEESDGSSSSDDDEEDGSEIDDELAKDYIEMIGGSEELMNTEWLAKNDIDADGGFLELNSSSDEDKEKLGAVDVMNASAVYGMMRKEKKKTRKGKSKSGSPMVEIGLSAAMDDLMFAKDPRSGRRRGKKALSQLSRSWPREGQRSREYYGVSGGRKKHRKELIAIKRRERMINRGVDLDQINSKLRQLVVHEVDMFSFQPMHSRDCSQVQRLASIYRLRSGCQGTGKKRYVTVTRTSQTCLPSSQDKIRLDKLLGEGIREDFVVNSETMTKSDRQLKGRSKNDRKLSLHQSAPAKIAKNGETSWRKKRYEKQSSAPYFTRPVPFVSCGTMQVDPATETPAPDSSEHPTNEKRKDPSSSKVGAFEMHTKGFGSKMMAKMGFIEGGGLGKDRQGRAHAIEATQRPKSLGLGMQFDEVAEKKVTKVVTKVTKVGRSETGSIGAFEKHTKGFGSKMMAKMGFVEGTGLGRDAQGVINPLTAVRRPKARGLGAES